MAVRLEMGAGVMRVVVVLTTHLCLSWVEQQQQHGATLKVGSILGGAWGRASLAKTVNCGVVHEPAGK